MTGNGIRIGFVNSFNAATGMASIYYPDRCHEVTDDLPVFAPFGLLQTLVKDDAVLVFHLSNGSEAGIILGSYSVEGDVPAAGIIVNNGTLSFKDASGVITLKEIIMACK